MEDLGGDKYQENTTDRVWRSRALFFCILSAFVPANILRERFDQDVSSVLFVLLDPPLCGPGTLTTLDRGTHREVGLRKVKLHQVSIPFCVRFLAWQLATMTMKIIKH